jgi:hypothetical protein
MTNERAWPSLPLDAWEDTYATLHRWTQIVGKVRLARMPWINHSWHVVLYVTSRGLTTGPMPDGARTFTVDFDFIDHVLRVCTSDGATRDVPLVSQSVATFYARVIGTLAELGVDVTIHGRPNELEDDTPFEQDHAHASYDATYVRRWWEILSRTDSVLQDFRARFIGKCSPVHFFWGSFDLAVTRFSGRRAPQHPGGIAHLPDRVVREAYSHEVSSIGFWPGGGPHRFPLFYSYAYPEPAGFPEAAVRPPDAFYSRDLHEFVLPYDAMRSAARPEDTLMAFAESSYAAAAQLGAWDREALERASGPSTLPGGP